MSNKSSRAGLSSSVNESLCCCEYRNMHGERSHLLAICCDCEALDETFDRIFKCERVPDSTIDRMLNTISDRCRLPTCFGRGAVKLRPDVITPAIVVPGSLILATLHPVMTVLCFLFMPLFIVTFHALWRRSDKNRRSLFFFSWGVTSVITSYLVFQCFVVAFREVLLWEILTVFTSVMIMFYLLYQAKRDPDLLIVSSKSRPSHKRTPSNPPISVSSPFNDEITGQEMEHKFPDNQLSSVSVETSGNNSSVNWTDSRSKGGKSDLPARTGYCKICESYIAVRDHHCVWIDSCVGASNHRSFLLAMILFVLTGMYSIHLTFTTICTPKMYFDWFLLPNDCRWLYNDFLTSICFVTGIYCIIVTSLMYLGLVYQSILISQNVTSHELAQARRQGLTKCIFFVPNNPNNQGILRNWLEFWLLSSRNGANRTTV
uniref:Palmitoyltransferase n=1 Tax=Arion vulgaris TaxID=1028688 RepID=A0A0B7A792_9EUPU